MHSSRSFQPPRHALVAEVVFHLDRIDWEAFNALEEDSVPIGRVTAPVVVSDAGRFHLPLIVTCVALAVCNS
jgi:hypothetical protein